MIDSIITALSSDDRKPVHVRRFIAVMVMFLFMYAILYGVRYTETYPLYSIIVMTAGMVMLMVIPLMIVYKEI